MRTVNNFIVALSMFGIVMSGPLHAATPQAPVSTSTSAATRIPDVRLNSDGLFVAQLVSNTGQPLSSRQLKISSREKLLTAVTTSPSGRVAVRGLNGGVFQIDYADQSTIFRLWTANAAPPNAASELMIVQNRPVARAQCDCEVPCDGGCDVGVVAPDGPNPFSGILGQEPIMIGLLVAAAIAIPIAVHNSGDSDDAS